MNLLILFLFGVSASLTTACGSPAGEPQKPAEQQPPGKPFAVVCPGGGWSYVGAIHEGNRK